MNDFDPNRFGLDDDPPTILRCGKCGQMFSTDDYALEVGDLCPICPALHPENNATELNVYNPE